MVSFGLSTIPSAGNVLEIAIVLEEWVYPLSALA
ncbi:uncharacterized protein FFB20_02930 [Fusarium fujikuroi]|nr:uncharacterized protein FFB20_02930 [Fusarium fujikuroi]SCN90871.1 uncharacterized protein FFE2_07118 [Fusarium fujikuroi]SCV46773.1 uncharacterized protein FFFS_07879 [Fusarium fujikuroi]